MNGWNCIVFFVRSTDLMALISINKIITMGNLSQAGTEFDHFGSNHFGSRVHLEFSVALRAALLDGRCRPGLAGPVPCRVHWRHTRSTYSGRLASTRRWCWTQSGTTRASQPTRLGCHVWMHRLHLLHWSRSRGRRGHPGRTCFSRPSVETRTPPHSASGKRVSPPRVSRNRSPLPRRGCGTCQHNQTNTASLPQRPAGDAGVPGTGRGGRCRKAGQSSPGLNNAPEQTAEPVGHHRVREGRPPKNIQTTERKGQKKGARKGKATAECRERPG